MSEVQRWADAAQFRATPHPNYSPGKGVTPQVHLLWMTPDPLGAVAAMSEMYKGNVVTDLAQITNEDRLSALADVQQTHLKAPLEAVKLHFMIDGVDRAFTHQLVRQRTAVYAQESLRFAVVEDLNVGTSLPPSLFGTAPLTDDDRRDDQAQRWRDRWDETLEVVSEAYTWLVENGMPAEEARGLLPHATATRLNYVTDLRNLSDHAGNRLCTQAQFHWRLVFNQIAQAIIDYGVSGMTEPGTEWQFEALVGSGLFRPVCYQLGRCPFKASFDRACTIRDRVDEFAKHGVPGDDWAHEQVRDGQVLQSINPAEWLMDPTAARS